jgi:dTDP-4-amino-4,6-dideoxygalactose transaminase
LVDVDAATLNMSSESLKDLLDSPNRPAAVMPVHFAGVPIDEDIYDLCDREGIPIVGDAAHAFGASDRLGRIAGRRSVADCFSFYATKNLTCGEGGAVATFDENLFEFVTQYRQHGLDRDAWRRHRVSSVDYGLKFAGTKGNLPDLLAAIGRAQLGHFDAMQRQRQDVINSYFAELAGVAGVTALPSMGATGSAHHLFVVVLDAGVDRSRLRARLSGLQVGTSVHFPPLHTYQWFIDNAASAPGGLPIANRLAQRVMSLPLHPLMGSDDVQQVCNALRTGLADQGF